MDWWVEKHDRHHQFPNHIEHDTDLRIKYLAFSKEQAREKRGFCRITTRYQHLAFLLLLLCEIWHLRVASVTYSLKARTRRANVDLALMIMHLGIYVGLLLVFLPFLHALAFMFVHSSLVGLYIGLTFAPNHKGMPLIEPGTTEDYLRQQVLTARNIRGGRFIDPLISYLYGGLNYQIEHHLFPYMPPRSYPRAAVIVQRFCEEKKIPYYAVSLPRAMRDVFTYLYQMGRYATDSSFS
jgi:fatty acid desaturase